MPGTTNPNNSVIFTSIYRFTTLFAFIQTDVSCKSMLSTSLYLYQGRCIHQFLIAKTNKNRHACDPLRLDRRRNLLRRNICLPPNTWPPLSSHRAQTRSIKQQNPIALSASRPCDDWWSRTQPDKEQRFWPAERRREL